MTQMVLPEAFTAGMQRLLQGDFEKFISSYDDPPVKALRLNPLKTGAGCKTPGMEDLNCAAKVTGAVPWEPAGGYYDDASSPGQHPFHAAGLYYIQEASAMFPVTLLSPKPGENVLDLCAAPGGKSTQIAAYLGGKGLLVANEVIPKRAKVLSENLERLCVANAIVLQEKTDRIAERFPLVFDAVLADAPCSGEGMFRKNPEAVKEWSIDAVAHCAERQSAILDDADACLKDGGRLVYATCTFSEEENERVVEDFLKRHPDYTVKEMHRLYPHETACEGQFAALLQKGTGSAREGSTQGRRTGRAEKLPDAVRAFFEENLTAQGRERLANMTIRAVPRAGAKGRQFAALPFSPVDLKRLHVLREGLYLGEETSGRFQPSHALALFLSPDDVKRSLDLSPDTDAALRYLQGYSLTLSDGTFVAKEDAAQKGMTLVTTNGFSLGFARLASGRLNNRYPKSLRKT